MSRKLFIISGGPGREREVSLSSGKNVAEALTKENISHEVIIVNEDRSWVFQGRTVSEREGVEILQQNSALVFQVIHGTYGEDGELTTLLEENTVPFVGSTPQAMRLTIDKYKTEEKLKENNIATTESTLVETISEIETVSVIFPAFVKPKDEGSSVSLFKVKNQQELKEALEKSIPEYGAMLVQPFVAGRELTCGVVEIGGETKALVPTEVILTKGETFDYEAKYTVGGSREITPAEISDETIRQVQELALRVHTVCGCKDISRTDMILQEDGTLVVL
ncbi:MAG: ATP-grasp domain-containing protein, partial [Candidatus Paceibacterota bacterium]